MLLLIFTPILQIPHFVIEYLFEGDDNMKKYINRLELMKGLKILKNNIKLGILTSSFVVISLTGCGKKEVETTEATTQATTQITTEATTELTTEATTEEKKSKDDIVKEFFNEQKKELNEYVDKDNIDKIKSKGKDIFTTFVDFIFYDGEIKGVKYDELSEGVKEQLYEDFCNIDEFICKYSPDYKENLSEKYHKVKDFISPYYYSAKEKIKEALGDDNLERLESIKENGKEVISDLWDKGKEKVKDKYEDWRDK